MSSTNLQLTTTSLMEGKMHRIRTLLTITLLATIGWLLASPQSSAQTITITSPVANTAVCNNTTVSIGWTLAGGATGPFAVVVTNLSTSAVVLSSGPIPTAANPTNWTVPTLAAQTNFQITVTGTNGGGGSVSTSTVVVGIPTVNITALVAQTICAGSSSGNFATSPTGGNGTFAYTNTIVGVGNFGGTAPTVSNATAASFTIGTTNVTPASCVAGTAGAAGATYGTYTVTQSVQSPSSPAGVGCIVPSSATLTVNRTADPTITFNTNPICAGSALSITLGFTGNSFGPYSFTLTDPCGTVRSSGTGNSVGSIGNVVVNLTADQTMHGNWTFTITSTATPACGVKTCVQALTVNTNPISATISGPTTICQGSPVTYTGTFNSGRGTFNYQWRRNGIAVGLPGSVIVTPSTAQLCANTTITSTIPSFTIAATAAPGDCGTYDCQITAAAAPCATTVTSNGVTLVVFIPSSFTTNPVSQSLCAGGNVTFTAALNAQPCGSVGFQWQKRCPVGAGAFTTIPGATGSSYTIVNVQVTDVGDYQCVTTGNACGVASSSIATLTVGQLPTTGTFAVTPATTGNCVGANNILMTFTPTSSSGNMTFQYQTQQTQPALGAVTNLGGAVNQTATIPSCVNQNSVAAPQSVVFNPACGGLYTTIMNVSASSCGGVSITGPSIEVNDPPTITGFTSNSPVCAPVGPLNLTVNSSILCGINPGWARSITYTVYRSTVNLATNPAPAFPANYTVTPTTATVTTVNPAFLSGVLGAQNYTNVALPAVSGTYRYLVQVTTPGCAQALGTTDVIVNFPPSIVMNPVGSRTVCAGTQTTFDATSITTGLVCTWAWAGPNGANIFTGTMDAVGNVTALTVTTNSGTNFAIGNRAAGTVGAAGTALSGVPSGLDLTVVNPQTTDAGTYTLTVSNGCSPPAVVSPVLNVNVPPTVVVSNQSVCVGHTVTMTANVPTGTGPFSYRWFKGGTGVLGSGTGLSLTGTGVLPSGSNYSGANTTTLTITSPQVADADNYYIEVTPATIAPNPPNVACGPVRSAAAVLTVSSSPTGLTITDVTSCVGQTFSLTAAGTGLGGGTAYSWYKGAVRLQVGSLGGRVTAAGQTLTITGAVISDAGTYTLRAANPPCDSAQASAAVIINTPTTLTGPGNQTVCAGTNVTLTVTANGTGPFTYQWYKGTSPGGTLINNGPSGNGSTVSGSTNQSLSINNVQTADAGQYYVRVSNATGCVPASVDLTPSIVLTVNSAPKLSQFYDTTICEGGTATFDANPASAGTPAGAYVWRKNGTVIVSGPTGNQSTYSITGARLQILGVKYADAGSYSLTVKNVCDSVFVQARLTVNVAPKLVLSGNQVVCKGRTATFTAAVTGTGPLSYVWTKGGANMVDGPTLWGSIITGTRTQTLTITNCDPQDNGQYILTVTGVCDPAAQNGLSLNVVTPPQLKILSTVNPKACRGDNVVFDVQATGTGNGAGGALQLIWEGPNGVIDPNNPHYRVAVDGDLTINGVTVNDAGLYRLTVVGVCDPNPTATFSLIVRMPPAFTPNGQPITQSVCPGNSATFSAFATGDSLKYQWFKNGVAITGATNATYTISPATVADEADYTVQISGTCPPAITSGVAKLLVGRAPVITQGPVDQTVCPGKSVTFTVVAGGTGLVFQWRKNGSPIPGATTATYTIPSAATGDAGSYDCVVSLPCAPFVASNTAVLTVASLPQLTTDLSGGTITLCEGVSQSIAITATGTGLSYQWMKNGQPISGAVSNSYTIAAAQLTDAGKYSVKVKGLCDSLQSKEVTVVVNAATRITQDPSPQSVCEGSTATFTATGTGTGITYQWQKNSQNIAGATNSSYTTPALTSGDNGSLYRCVISGTCDPKQLITKEVAVTLKRVIVGTMSAKIDTIQIGDSAVADLIFQNNSQSDVTISSISQLTAPFRIVSVTPSVPATLKPGQTLTARIRFNPTEPGVKRDSIQLTITEPCNATAVAYIVATGDERKALVELIIEDMRGSVKSSSPVEMVIKYAAIPIGYDKVNPSSVDMEIAYNATMLTPKDPTLRSTLTFKKGAGIPVGDTAIMKISVPNVPTSGEIIRIPMYVLLGNDSISPLMFYSLPKFTPQGGGKIIVTNTINGKFVAEDLCFRGDGFRGLADRFTLVKLAPNPAVTALNIAYTSPAGSQATARLYDMQGNEHISIDLPVATTGVSETTMNVRSLPTGMYLLVIQSDGQMIRQIVSIVK